MFATWIQEARARLPEYGWRRSLLGRRQRLIAGAIRRERIDETLIADYERLTERGRVVWAAVAQANAAAFEPGDMDFPANIIFGTDPYFDACPHHLLRVARAVFKLKGTFPEDPVLARVAAAVSDEQNYLTNWRLPYKLTDGHALFFSSLMLHRSRLPQRRLSVPVLPVAVAPESVSVCMVVPLECWPGALRGHEEAYEQALSGAPAPEMRSVSQAQLDDDERTAREQPYKRLLADDLVPGASKAVITLTLQCARVVREHIAGAKWTKPWHLRIGGSEYARTMDISGEPVPTTHAAVESEGITIAVPRSQLNQIRGTVIDYRASHVGAGFVFVDPY